MSGSDLDYQLVKDLDLYQSLVSFHLETFVDIAFVPSGDYGDSIYDLIQRSFIPNLISS